MITATCAALALALANPASAGNTFHLVQDCPAGAAGRPALLVRTAFARPVTIEAAGRTVAGIEVRGGGNIIWRGGTITAPGGAGIDATRGSPAFYGVRIYGLAANVAFEGVHFTDARKAIVADQASNISVRYSRCDGWVEDCVIASRTAGLVFTHNSAGPFNAVATRCTLPDGSVVRGLPSRTCTAQGGAWVDGWHSDVVQLRNGAVDVLAAFNTVNTTGQGFTQMDTTGDAPLARVRFAWNKIAAGRHGLTLGACIGCLIDHNHLRTAVPGWRAVVMPGQAKACGNVLPDALATSPGRQPC